MRIPTFVVAAAVSVSLLTSVVFAQTKDEGTFMLGYGTSASCGKYVEVRDEERRSPGRWEHVSYMSWINGFVSGANWGLNAKLNGALKGTDLEGLLGWLEKYCRENPLDKLGNASLELIRELVKRSVR